MLRTCLSADAKKSTEEAFESETGAQHPPALKYQYHVKGNTFKVLKWMPSCLFNHHLSKPFILYSSCTIAIRFKTTRRIIPENPTVGLVLQDTMICCYCSEHYLNS
jgi:hypothetical protein